MQDPVTVDPSVFDGRFFFTNATNEDFIGYWDSIAYTFPAKKTSPIVIPTATSEQIQVIRKKFARELAEREFYKSDKLKKMEASTPIGQGEHLQTALTYAEKDLEPFIQQCLDPLPIGTTTAKKEQKKDVQLRTDENGNPVSKVLKNDKDSLVGNGEVVA